MTDKEALLVALEALHYCEALNRDVDERKMQAITVIRKLWTEHAMKETQRLGQEIEQEPVALVIDGVLVKYAFPKKYTGHLYTTPPQRTWVGLTDEKIDSFSLDYSLPYSTHSFARAIESKLKEKNT